MRVYTVTCDGRPAALVIAADPSAAVARALEVAEKRNLLGFVGPRRFAAREASSAEKLEWSEHRGDSDYVILDMPLVILS